MGTILASAVIQSASVILQDPGYNRFTLASQLVRLNNAQRTIVMLKPDTSVTQGAVVLVAGTRQSLPAGGIQLINATRNMGTDGTTVGNVITLVDKEVMDSLVPGWHSVTADAVVQHVMFDNRDPAKFYVYPQQPTSGFGYIDLVYSVSPAEVATTSAAITLDDIYKGVLVNLICYEALTGEADVNNIQKAQNFYAMAERALGIKDTKENEDDPNR